MGKRLWVERNKDGSWDAFSDDGAHIKFGKGKGQFSPGDLMKIALASTIFRNTFLLYWFVTGWRV